MIPVDLIVANQMHHTAQRVHELGAMPQNKPHLPPPTCPKHQEALARRILASVAELAALPIILAALKAVEGPASLAEIGQALQSAMDVQRKQRGEAEAETEGVQ